MSAADQNPSGCGQNDVVNAYHVFLGRPPEHAYPSTWLAASDLAPYFINSEEFHLDVAQPILRGRFPPLDRFDDEPTPTLRRWMSSFLPVSARSRRKLAQTKQWREALWLIFSDAEFRKAVAVKHRSWDLGTLAANLKKQRWNVSKRLISASNRNGIFYSLITRWVKPKGGAYSLADVADPDISAYELQADLDRDILNASVEETEHMVKCVQAIARSPMFDRVYYASVARLDTTDFELARHYLLIGETEGFRPSLDFNPGLYYELHPDVSDAGLNALLHYELSGKNENRKLEKLIVDKIVMRKGRIDPSKSTIILVCHQASRTGAPILGWNLAVELSGHHNVVVVLLDGGELEEAFEGVSSAVVGPVRQICSDPTELWTFASRIVTAYSPLYVIGNSVESGKIAMALREQGCALLLLVHEFSSHSRPRGILKHLYAAADQVVFPAPLVAQSSIDDYDQLRLQNVQILPQGPSRLPPSNPVGCVDVGMIRAVAPQGDPQLSRTAKEFLVIGLGAVDLRKGVDLFLATATCLKRIAPDLDFRFVWIGHDFNPGEKFRTLLNEQVERSGLGKSFEMREALDDLALIYEAADALLLSSRLDPLPNVAIDAVMGGLPVVCFQNATGFAEFLTLDSQTAHLAVPHMDIGAAAEVLSNLGYNKPERNRLGTLLASRAKETFNMSRYAARLNELGLAAAGHAQEAAKGADLLAQDSNFDAPLFAGRDVQGVSKDALINRYLEESRRWAFSGGPVWGLHPRRPLAGFHPMAYAAQYEKFPQNSGANPLVHFLKEGRPAGSWYHPSIRIESQQKIRSQLSAVIHGHFHYIDNFNDFLNALNVNNSKFDLIITTTSKASKKYLEEMARRYRNGTVQVLLGPNIGRDVGPFLKLLCEGAFDGYDAVAHVHGKRSLHTMSYDQELGNRWRVFLWEHLIGPSTPAADIILQAMQEDPKLGLIFPENPEVIGWELNFSEGERLAKRMGLKMPLSPYVDFPVGTMFWARPGAMLPFVKAGFTDLDYPEEPLPVDGTMLHAIERLLTPAALHAGYSYASVYNPSLVRT